MSFNPCYVGCCSGILVLTVFREYVKKVSILVMLDVAREYRTEKNTITAEVKFQSLLCWMLLGNIIHNSSKNIIIKSFNPCYVGCCSGIFKSKNKFIMRGCVSILVMLDVARE